MKFIKPKDFIGSHPWDAMEIANMDGITTKLHWTDAPYKWHINDGEEVFVVLDGEVEMHYKQEGEKLMERLGTGDIFFASIGAEHVAHPIGETRVLVVENAGSI